jgi:hypothetical protein
MDFALSNKGLPHAAADFLKASCRSPNTGLARNVLQNTTFTIAVQYENGQRKFLLQTAY